MNKRLIKSITFDFTVFYSLIAIYLFGGSLSPYAENALTFFGGFILVISVFSFFMIDRMVEARLKRDAKKKTKVHMHYTVISTIFEVMLFAALGWYWMAVALILPCVIDSVIEDRM
tara:strand:- start:731 stop:1078 length:348 start_codon:yes stop_codon:yes gene_type:complete